MVGLFEIGLPLGVKHHGDLDNRLGIDIHSTGRINYPASQIVKSLAVPIRGLCETVQFSERGRRIRFSSLLNQLDLPSNIGAFRIRQRTIGR
ncbi:MAG: hypothetical protein BWY42_00849 [Candidatus Omnitrophica bacterium ADurb.Bin277]|nr:MAG: hypothetical protein BWY42_00849 [Candidatus Omnitrophica bacterium ADurb.Bin277]